MPPPRRPRNMALPDDAFFGHGFGFEVHGPRNAREFQPRPIPLEVAGLTDDPNRSLGAGVADASQMVGPHGLGNRPEHGPKHSGPLRWRSSGRLDQTSHFCLT